MTISEQIIAIRKAAGVSQVDLARMLGLTPGAVCNYEKGRRPIRAHHFEKIKALVDRMAKYDERAAILRRNDIPKGHLYNVINPNKTTSSGNPFYAPVEWVVKLTRDSRDYFMIKKVARDCGGLFISPDDIKELNDSDPEKTLAIIQKIIGMVK